MAESTNTRAAAIPLTDEGKLRLVYLLLMHQGLSPIKLDGFDPGTGHSTRAIQGLLDRLKKQYITDAKEGDAQASIATKASAPKKRGRAAKTAAAEGETEDKDSEQPAAKKGRKKATAKKTEEQVTGDDVAEDGKKATLIKKKMDDEALDDATEETKKPAAKKGRTKKVDKQKTEDDDEESTRKDSVVDQPSIFGPKSGSAGPVAVEEVGEI